MILASRELGLPTKEFHRVCASRWPSCLPHSGLRIASLRFRGGAAMRLGNAGSTALLIDEFEARPRGEKGGLGGLVDAVAVDAARGWWGGANPRL